MGQAFDRDGNVLGEAYGDTKQEVFDKLTKEFKDAAEIRVRSMESPDMRGGDFTRPVAPAQGQPDRMMAFFTYKHLPAHLQAASKPFCDLAEHIVANIPSNPERTVALRKLLEAKDCAVRALL